MLTNDQVSAFFAAFAAQPNLFQLKPAATRKAALDVVLAQIKHKDCKLETLRRIADAIGSHGLVSMLDEMKSPALATLVKKYDKANAERAKDGQWARAHLAALARREIEPAPIVKAKKPSSAKPKPPKTSDLVRTLHQSKALARRG
jgi:hypothetical protein